MRKIRRLAIWLMGTGILAFVVGVLLGGPDGDKAGIYCAESSPIFIVMGIGLYFWYGLRSAK